MHKAKSRILKLVTIISMISGFLSGITVPANANSPCVLGTDYTRVSASNSANLTLRFTNTTTCVFTIPTSITSVTALVVGAGGGGGADGGSGGGGGELRQGTVSVTPGATMNIKIGIGGAGSQWGPVGSNGENSTITGAATFTAVGGNLGAGWNSSSGGAGGSGGSGGSGTNGQQGGGGPGGVCNPIGYGSSPSGTTPSSTITGSTVYFGGGGGGGFGAQTNNGGTGFLGAAGGTNSGGRGANYKISSADSVTAINGASTGYPGVANTGGGGGAGSACNARGDMNLGYDGVSQRTAGGAGANGVVYLQYSSTPSPVTGVSVTSNENSKVTISWTAPTYTGSGITGYRVQRVVSGGNWEGELATGSTAASYVYTGLTNGTEYFFRVTPVTDAGTAPFPGAGPFASGIPAAPPGAPTIGTPTIASSASISVAFTAPASNGGSAITGYTVTSSPGGITATGTSSPITVTGLTNGTAYTFTVTATNAAGTSVASSASVSITPATVPGAPTIGTPTIASATSISVAFTAPASNGGRAITGYTVTSSPGGITATGSSSPIIVTGLTAGTAYTFTVTATNAIGTSLASSASASITPNVSPTSSTAPVASGTMAVGQVLSVTNGTWNNNPASYTYVWSRSATLGGTYNAISGATSNTYTLASADNGFFIRANVTAVNSAGSATASATASLLTGSALNPTFDTPTPTSNGFTVQINNYDANFTWAGTATASGTVTISGTGLVTVTGVAPGTSSTATITTTRTNYTGGSSTVSATSNLGAALNPTFGSVTATANGFTVQISNHDASYTWAGTATANGTVTVSGSGLVTVTGVEPGTSSTATITTTRTGYTSGSATISGTSTARATVTNVTSTATNGSIKSGTQISITVTFSRAVTVTGSPRLTLETGTTDREATYFSGSASTLLTFVYTVQSGDNSADLDYVSTSSLTLNGGTIKDSSSVDVSLTLPAPGAAGSIAANKALVIDGIAPTVTSVTSSTANGNYKLGASTIPIQVSFSENVTVAVGTPYIELSVGSNLRVDYASGSGTSTLTFNYSIQSGHVTADLDYVSTASLSAFTGTITDAAGNAAVLTLPSPGAAGSLGANKNIVIDTVIPTVTSVTSDLANGSYKAGQVIPVKVVFSEAVIVTGTPTLGLSVTGGVARAIDYSSGSGTSNLIFNYTVQAGDISSDLNYAATTSLNLNSGTISDAVGNTANLTLASPSSIGSLGLNKAIVIDTVTPTLSTVSASTGSYSAGQVISVRILFSETMVVTGSPTIALNITNNSVQSSTLIATYASGSGTSTLIFNYTVQAGDSASDLDYTTTTALQLNGGSITDAAGNSPSPFLPSPGASGSLGATSAVVLDTNVPTISTVRSPSNTHGVGRNVDVTVTFSEAVTVAGGGLPRILLETGSTDRYAVYLSGTGSTNLVFRYTVQAGDESSDLNYVSTTSLELNSGTIKDGAGNNATLTLPDLASSNSIVGGLGNVVIDTVAPTVVSITSTTADGTYKAGSSIVIRILFSKAVNVGTSSQLKLTLETGSTKRDAAYSTGSGTNTLTFVYTVQTGDAATDLDYVSTSAFSIGTSTFWDIGFNPAVLTLPAPGAAGSLGASSNIAIDTAVPATPTNFALSASSDSGQSNTDGITNKSQLTFTGTAGPNQTITLNSTAQPPPSCTSDSNGNFSCLSFSGLTPGSYTFTATATNAAGTISAASSSVAVTIDYTAPTFSSSQVPSAGDKIILTYNGTLSTVTAPLSAFAATINAVSVSISSVVISGSTVELTLAKKVIQGATVRFSYTDPSGLDDVNAIQDVAGNDAVSRSLAVVTNNNSTLTAPSIATPSVGLTAIAMTLYNLPITGATGGTGPYTYAVTTGLADLTSVGLSFDTSDINALKITGTPTAAKSAFAVVITVTDSNGVDKATGSFNITVTSSSQLPITIATRYGTGGQALVLAIQGGSGSGALTYTLDPLVQTSCLLSGSVLTPNFAAGASGTCYVKATRAADAAFTATSSATTAIFFTAYVPVIQQTFTCPAGTTPSAPSGIGVGSCIQVLAPVSPTEGDAGAAPKITALSATSGLVGATITITGTGFSTVTRVQFGTKSTTTFTATSTTITVDVPTGATRGRVMVVSPTGTAMAAQIFTVTIPDTQAPGFTGGSVNTSSPTLLTLNFDETIDGAGVLATSFAVLVNGASRSITAISISGTTITLTLSSAVSATQTVDFTYTSPGDSTSIKDAVGNKTATITSTRLTNNLS